MNASERRDLLRQIEDSEAVDSWRWKDLRIWPLVRMLIAFQSYDRLEPGAGSSLTPVAQIGGRARRTVSALVASTAISPRMPKADAVFFGDGVSGLWLRGRWFDRLTDPLRDVLEQEGLSSHQLEISDAAHAPRFRSSDGVGQQMKRIWMLGRIARTDHLHAPGLPAIASAIDRAGVDPEVLSARSLSLHAHFVEHAATWFAGRLRRSGARVGFGVDYGAQSMAFYLACARSGLPSVEIQHGLQGLMHWAYSDWTKVPRDGYDLLPRYYWVWSEHEAESILKWSSQLPRHQPLIGGNLWLERWLRAEPQDELVQEIRKDPRLTQGGSDRRRVLLTLEAHYPDPVVSDLLGALVSSTLDELQWWIRLHPTTGSSERSQALARIKNWGLTEVDLSKAEDVPLYALLPHMDVHLTHRSSVVVEAARFGVPSVMLDLEGEAFFPVEAEGGGVFVSQDRAALTSMLVNLPRCHATRPQKTKDAASLVRSLLDSSSVSG